MYHVFVEEVPYLRARYITKVPDSHDMSSAMSSFANVRKQRKNFKMLWVVKEAI